MNNDNKFSLEYLFQFLLAIAGVALMLGGLVMFVSSFFTALPILISIQLFSLGAILFVVTKLYFYFRAILDEVTKVLMKLNVGNSPHQAFDVSHNAEVISIDANTSPEEIEKLKKEHPMMAAAIDRILNHQGIHTATKNITALSDKQLEEELKAAVADNNFERAAEIRDEINKRKNKPL